MILTPGLNLSLETVNSESTILDPLRRLLHVARLLDLNALRRMILGHFIRLDRKYSVHRITVVFPPLER